MNIDSDIGVLQMDVHTFQRLSAELDRDDNWVKLAQHFELFDQQEIRRLSTINAPGNNLLNELGNKLCSVDVLARALRRCKLFDALALITAPEKLKVVQQPTEILLDGKNSLIIANGGALKLEFVVVGIPPPEFSWFKDSVRLPGHNSNTFLCDNFNANNEGTYYCTACQTMPNGEVEQITSNEIKVEILPFCVIKQKPQEIISIKEGSPLFLKVEADGHPQVNYQWIHGNSIIDHNNDCIYIERSEAHHAGEYRCIVSNACKEICVKFKVIVYSEKEFPVYEGPVRAKLALLIGNGEYENCHKLATPEQDVEVLADILVDLGFTVYVKNNQTLEEMRSNLGSFAECCEKGAMVIFYFAGHGFRLRSNYLLPVDAPPHDRYLCVDALSEEEILGTVLNTEPILLVSLLDMCLTLPDKSNNPAIFKEATEVIEVKSNRNLIQGYATTSQFPAFEIKGTRNGVYVNVLRKYMKQDDPPLPILTILERVNTELASDGTIGQTRQMPSFYTNTAQNFFLNLEKLRTFN